MRYTPFDVDLHEIDESHLAGLREVSEGWYVEYKSQVPRPRDLAKSLSSFANRHGGWLLLGVQENPEDNTADSFSGIPDAEVTTTVQQLRDAAKDLLTPSVPFFHHILKGPLNDIGLPSGRSIVTVRIPEGAATPYVHHDGRVYVRTGDSSSPVPANDRATLDLLHRKAEDKMSLLEELVDRTPTTSQGEEDTTFLHLVICSDPFQVLGHWYAGRLDDFSTTMSASHFPFDNIYTSQEGFVARQARGNDQYNRIFTWEFSRKCNSFITVPLPTMTNESLTGQADQFYVVAGHLGYEHGADFASLIARNSLEPARVINLNILLMVLSAVVKRHRSLAAHAGVMGPFYIKARVENSWRVIPFIDTSEYISHIKRFGIPVVQETELSAPLGNWPEGFIAAPEVSPVPGENERVPDDGVIGIWLAVMQAFGIPGDVIARSAIQTVNASNQEAERHRRRLL